MDINFADTFSYTFNVGPIKKGKPFIRVTLIAPAKIRFHTYQLGKEKQVPWSYEDRRV